MLASHIPFLVTSNHLKKGYPWIVFTGTRCLNELHWLVLTIGYRNCIPTKGHEVDMPHGISATHAIDFNVRNDTCFLSMIPVSEVSFQNHEFVSSQMYPGRWYSDNQSKAPAANSLELTAYRAGSTRILREVDFSRYSQCRTVSKMQIYSEEGKLSWTNLHQFHSTHSPQ